MGNRHFLLLFLLGLCGACGQDQTLANNKLESFSNITVSDSTKVDKDGTLLRSTTADTIGYQGTSYPISKYSSKQALDSVAKAPRGTTLTVRFNGDVMGSEMLLKVIEVR